MAQYDPEYKRELLRQYFDHVRRCAYLASFSGSSIIGKLHSPTRQEPADFIPPGYGYGEHNAPTPVEVCKHLYGGCPNQHCPDAHALSQNLELFKEFMRRLVDYNISMRHDQHLTPTQYISLLELLYSVRLGLWCYFQVERPIRIYNRRFPLAIVSEALQVQYNFPHDDPDENPGCCCEACTRILERRAELEERAERAERAELEERAGEANPVQD